LHSGPYQNETGNDGIGDTPYVIDENNRDHYPLMNPWTPIEIDPDILNLRTRGKWITSYIELPEYYNVSDIDVSSIMLNGSIPAELHPVGVGDYDNDTVPDLMVKFNRTQVAEYILSKGIMTGNVTLTISGYLIDGTMFEGSDIIRVRMPRDINIDGKVDIKDIFLAIKAFNSIPEYPRWNPIADENEDNKIDIRDIFIIIRNFGKTGKQRTQHSLFSLIYVRTIWISNATFRRLSKVKYALMKKDDKARSPNDVVLISEI